MRGEVTVADALVSLESGGVKEREKGLENLRYIIRNNQRLDQLSDNAFKEIFETLFNVVSTEQSVYLNAKTPTTRTAAEKRLSSSANALRLTVEGGSQLLRKLKTISILVENVLQTFHLPDGSFCEPVALDFAKLLQALFAYQPHVEHLPADTRKRIALFCVKCITEAQVELEESDITRNTQVTTISHRSSRSQLKDSSGSQSGKSFSRQIAQEMIACVLPLTAASNTNYGSNTSNVMWALIDTLRRHVISTAAHRQALAAVNNLLSRSRTENLQLTLNATTQLVLLTRTLWPAKARDEQRMKDEILRTWIYILPYIDHAALQESNQAIRQELVSTLGVLRNEHSSRPSREQLQIDDLRLTFGPESSNDRHVIELPAFRLKSNSVDSELRWTNVYMIASMCRILSKSTTEDESSDDEDTDVRTRPRKRQRLTDEIEDTIAASANVSLHPAARISALQTLTFLAQQSVFSDIRYVRTLNRLSIGCTDDNGLVASWTFMAIACLATQSSSTSDSVKTHWNTLYRLARRAVSNAGTCRAACHLLYIMLTLRLVSQEDVSELVHTMTASSNLNGPAILADSVTNLLRYLVCASQSINPMSSSATAESVLGWLLRSFIPSKFEEKAYASQHVLYTAKDVIELAICCLGQPRVHSSHAEHPVWHSVGQTWLACGEQSGLVSYLLLLPDRPSSSNAALSVPEQSVSCPRQSQASLEKLLLDFAANEVRRMRERWTLLMQTSPQGISVDMFSFFCLACHFIACITFCPNFEDSHRQKQLQSQVTSLLSLFSDFLASSHCDQEKSDLALAIFSQACVGLSLDISPTKRPKCETAICHSLQQGLSRQYGKRDGLGLDDDEEDLMQVDINQESQTSVLDGRSADALNTRTELAMACSVLALRANVTLYATLVVKQSADANDAQSNESIVSHLLSLPDPTLLAAKKVLSSLPALGIDLTTAQSEQLLEYCSEKFLSGYSHDKSEIALCAMLDVMSSFASVWTKRGTTLYDLGLELYEWYAVTMLPTKFLSTAVQERLASLLLGLCQVDTEYGKVDDQPSVRTSLFTLLRTGSVAVQFHLANRISAIFGLFVLSQHQAMFADLQENLTEDTEYAEGMAIRLLLFARLASSWRSLLRPCVYYMFENAGKAPNSAKHAAQSIAELAGGLGFESPQGLFRLFAAQLLYSWSDRSENTLANLPFSVFRYESLEALVAENETEITGQLVMRGNDGDLQFVANALSTSKKDLATRSFAKSLAYCIGWDVAKGLLKDNAASAESHLRNLVNSKETYRSLIRDNFPAVMGEFHVAVQLDEDQDEWFQKHDQYHFAAEVAAEMKSFGHSQRPLPPSQQPCFRSRNVCSQVERLCRRIGYDPLRPWDPPSFALAARMLLDSINDALGPLQIALIIRKLRLLVSLAGDVALAGFPLEMLLHSIRPFIVHSECADDAMGVVQYLFHHGREHMQANPSFMHGTVMLIILQIREYSGSKQSPTTQESQHRSTIGKMESLQQWLIRYLQECQPSKRSGRSDRYVGKYGQFAGALARAKLPGSALKGTPQSALLLLILDAYSESLFARNHRQEAISLLSKNFEIPVSNTADCIEHDKDCRRYAQGVWEALDNPDLGESFVAWAAGVLGRAYAATGNRPRTTNRAPHTLVKGRSGMASSQATVARSLADRLFSRAREEASRADYTLRRMFQSFATDEQSAAFAQMLPDSVVAVVARGTQGYRPAWTAGFRNARPAAFSQLLEPDALLPLEKWAQTLGVAICHEARTVAEASSLTTALQDEGKLALDLLPYIVHILVAGELEAGAGGSFRQSFSELMVHHLDVEHDGLRPKQRYLLKLLLYLRSQAMPGEHTQADRQHWLEIDWSVAAKAAAQCGMPTTALLLTESATTSIQKNRRSSSRNTASQSSQMTIAQVPPELLLSIFKQVEEPDSFYGVEQPASLDSVLDRLDYESNGLKSLMFRSAATDTHLRSAHQLDHGDTSGIIRSLSMLNLNSLTFTLLSGKQGDSRNANELVKSAQNLQQWDIMPPESASGWEVTCFTVFQDLSRSVDNQAVHSRLTSTLGGHMNSVRFLEERAPSHAWFSALASLTEFKEVISSSTQEEMLKTWEKMLARQTWMELDQFAHSSDILSNRHTLFSILAQNRSLLDQTRTGLKECHTMEIQSLLHISSIARGHSQLQEALTATTQVNDLAKRYAASGLDVSAAARQETATVLWDAGEPTSSVKLLQEALGMKNLEHQDIPVGRSGLQAELAHQLAEARLEKPDNIFKNNLEPAIQHLESRIEGEEAGKVFHEFATFCDKQLQNPDNIDDFNRITKLRREKWSELQELYQHQQRMRNSGTSDFKSRLTRAETWYKIDDAEYKRQQHSRETFMQQSLRNYLQALRASNKHNISVLRFFAFWLEHAGETNANTVVEKYLQRVPSWKFVVIMNQLMSRLENDQSIFQKALRQLVTRICSEHPYHSLLHLYATAQPVAGQDTTAESRQSAAEGIANKLRGNAQLPKLLESVFRANRRYDDFAYAATSKNTPNRVSVSFAPEAELMVKEVPDLKVPPATLNLSLRPDGKYSDNIPVITRFSSTVSLMSGISRPKKITAYGSDGREYAQLFKSGADDLRQDTIMEQVFEEVSKMLRNHKATRQRNLHVRTYKVLPLSSSSGIIEFVPNSRALADVLVPAHRRYHPSDMDSNTARSKISSVDKQPTDTRVREFRKVCDQIHPVLRHFFFERFQDPDDWFAKRTAYTRTTATISILGWVLGLGDRHCQNIMLDEKTGDVVHIDLGIAFEAGRVLPIPETVPFRLSRDVVDGMGITRTEGVFRRCCEFTLDALREERDSIMTLLNVLRYDPLYAWTVSPVRAKRMQEDSARNAGGAEGTEGAGGVGGKKAQQSGEAERALSVVEKKLTKMLSTPAAVNELIQQATDERNLATLFQGWSAFF